MEEFCIFKLRKEIKALYFAVNEEDSLDDFSEWFRDTALVYAYEHQRADEFEELDKKAMDVWNTRTFDINQERPSKEERLWFLTISTELVCLALFEDEMCPEKLKERWQQMLQHAKDELMLLRLRML